MNAAEIAGLLGAQVKGNPNAWVDTVDDIKGGKKCALSFISDPVYLKFLPTTKANVLLVQDTIDTS